MIIDSHAHAFPFLGDSSGFPSSAIHLQWLQSYLAGHGYPDGQPARRLRDDAIVVDTGLAALPVTGFDCLADVGFRVGDNGRFLWEVDGETLYMHYMPPSLQTNSCDPEYLLTEMTYAGVDVAVLQNAHPYGFLNDYFAEAIIRHPGRLIGLAAVDELTAATEGALAALRRMVNDLGFRGLYYATRGFLPGGSEPTFDDEQYDPFWHTVRELGIPVFWEVLTRPGRGVEDLLPQLARLNRWADRYPDIPSVYTHGFNPSLLDGNLEEPVSELLRREQFLIELVYPISWGREHDYPYLELKPALNGLWQRVGQYRLIWGSDMPNVLRHCTYAQSRTYLETCLQEVGSAALASVQGENLRELFEDATDCRRQPEPRQDEMKEGMHA